MFRYREKFLHANVIIFTNELPSIYDQRLKQKINQIKTATQIIIMKNFDELY